jgi:hypothetical protein
MKTICALIAMTTSFTLMLSINSHSYAFHENLGIDDNKASELYRANPNDPAIVQWKNGLQSAITGMDKCFTIQEAISCQSLIPIIVSNCKSHPNTLLACNDARLPQYPLILKKAQEAQIMAQKEAEEEQKRAEEEQKRAEEEAKKTRGIRIQAYGTDMLDKCFLNSFNASSKFEVASLACDLEMRSLQGECQMANNTLDYCKDERFVGFLKKYGIVNSTVPPYSNLTGNSTYP